MKIRLGRSSELRMFIRYSRKRTMLVCVCGRFKALTKESIWASQHHSSTMFIWVALQESVRLARILWIITGKCPNQGLLPVRQKNDQKQKPRRNLLPKRYLHGPMTWKVMQISVERYWEFAHITTEQLHKVATPCLDDHQFNEEENGFSWRIVHSLLTNCSKMSIFGSCW